MTLELCTNLDIERGPHNSHGISHEISPDLYEIQKAQKCSFVLAPLSASVASFGQLFEKVQWNIPRQVNLSCLNISIYVHIYIYRLYIHVIYIYICVSEEFIHVHKYKQEDTYICMYTIAKNKVYVCTCLYTYTVYVSKCDFYCVILCIYI